MFSIFSGRYPEEKLLSHIVVLFFTFLETSLLFSIVTAPNLHFQQKCMKLPFSPHPHQHLLFLVLMIIDILTGERWYLMVLICISLITNDVVHLFMYLLAICISSLEKCLVRSSAYLFSILIQGCLLIFEREGKW